MSSTSEAVARIRTRARRTLFSQCRAMDDQGSDLDRAQLVVQHLRDYINDLNHAARVPGNVSHLVVGSVLQAGFPVFLECHRHGDHAQDLAYHIWADHTALFGITIGSGLEPLGLHEPLEPTSVDLELLGIYHLAVGASLRHADQATEARLILRRLATTLDLSFDDIGRMFGVTGETARRWERGLTPVPASRAADLTKVNTALDRLLSLFRPERLPLAMRRPAELFGGERALDWLLRGQIEEVAERYDRVLSYQQ